MFEHLGTWEYDASDARLRLDLWDTGSERLHYALAFIPTKPVSAARGRCPQFEAADFRPSPMSAIDSDETAGALIGFFAAYAEAARMHPSERTYGEDPIDFTATQWALLGAYSEELSMWTAELTGELS